MGPVAAWAAAADGNDFAFIEEAVGEDQRLVQKPARIVAQVEDHPGQTGPEFFVDVGERLLDAHFHFFREPRNADIADVALDVPAHGLYLDDRPGQRNGKVIETGAADGQGNLRSRPPPHALDRLQQGLALDRLAVDMGDQVPGL